MSIKKNLTIILIILALNSNSQSKITFYKGGEKQLYNDLLDNIDVSKYKSNFNDHFCQAFIYISKKGKIDSISFKSNSLNYLDTIVLNGIKKTESNWLKNKKSSVLLFTAWFINYNKSSENFVMSKQFACRQKTYYAEEVFLLPDFLLPIGGEIK